MHWKVAPRLCRICKSTKDLVPEKGDITVKSDREVVQGKGPVTVTVSTFICRRCLFSTQRMELFW